MSANLRAVLLALAAFGIFATHDVIVKSLGGSYSAFQIVFFSVLFGFPIATILLLRDQTVGNLIPRHPWWTAARTAAAVVTGAAAFFAFSLLPLAQTYAILFASPLLITILAIPMLGEKVGWRRGAAVLVGLVGVMVVLQPGSTQLGIGHLAALLAAVCGAFASIVVRKIGRDERSIVLILYPMVANFAVMAALMPFVYRPMPFIDMAGLFAIALMAMAATFCLITAYKIGQAALVAPMQYSQILWAAAYGILFFDEAPAWNTALGAGIIIASGLYIVLRESRGGRSANTPVLQTRSRAGTPAAPNVSTMIRMQGDAPVDPVPAQDVARPTMRGLPGRTQPRR
ncbi:MAG: DMT family transporter [Shimia sp.]